MVKEYMNKIPNICYCFSRTVLLFKSHPPPTPRKRHIFTYAHEIIPKGLQGWWEQAPHTRIPLFAKATWILL